MATLKLNSKGDAVKQLQQNLKDLGYTISVDGVFGKATEQVVIQFQKDNRLSPDGIVGVNTQSVIDALISKTPIYGIDISHHNGAINFNKINWNIVKFVYCKASQGKVFQDDMFPSYFGELKRLGIYRGAYHFFTFKGITAAEQADNFLSCGINFSEKGVLPPVLDLEWQQTEELNNYIKNNLSACVKKVKDWLDIVEQKTKRKPIIYTARGFWTDYMKNSENFKDYQLWVAYYSPKNPTLFGGWTDYAIWQFTESGSVEGFPGNVDKNVFKGSLSKLKSLANT